MALGDEDGFASAANGPRGARWPEKTMGLVCAGRRKSMHASAGIGTAAEESSDEGDDALGSFTPKQGR